MILVLTGTHHQPFDRLVRASAALAAGGERVVVQTGASRLRPEGCEVSPWFSPEAIGSLADRADVIVAHGGPGSLFIAWDRGMRPVVVPRDPRRGEHVDDHQLRFAASLAGRAEVIEDIARLPGAVERVRGVLEPVISREVGAREDFVARFDKEIRAVVARSRKGSPARGDRSDE